MVIRAVSAALLVAAALAAGVAAAAPVAGAAPPTPEVKPTLKPFGTCGGLVRYARRRTEAIVVQGDEKQRRAPSDQYSSPVAGESPAEGGGAAPDFSETNVQEAGIDEPDRVKTDGRRIYVVDSDQSYEKERLYVLDARGGTPRVLGSVLLPGYGAELLMHGDRVLAISYGDDGTDDYGVATVLSEIDVSDPETMRVLRTEKVDGEYVSARRHGPVARVVISSSPREVVAIEPDGDGWTPAQEAAQAERAVARAPLATWRPDEVLADRRLGIRVERPAIPCTSIRRPRVDAGLGMLTVLTVDMERGLPAVDSDAVLAQGETVYAGADALYVATEREVEPGTDLRGLQTNTVTAVHKFAIAGAATSYRASGFVPGWMLSQWSMSEHEGHLRTATTTEPPWDEDDDEENDVPTESQVLVLAERDGELVEVGRAGGLGRGEEIQAVRFMGDRGFVVTFRQVDPLYTLDLSVPGQPRTVGELKIRGYSAYLHPVGENLLLGVGQDATERGRTLGVQLSLFDVSDLARPRRLHQHALGDSFSEAEWDHHAFLYWAPTGLTVIPVEAWSEDADDDRGSFTGAIGFRVDASAGISEAGRISHPRGYDWAAPARALVIGERLFTVGEGGVRASRLGDLSEEAWMPVLPPQGDGPARGGTG